VKLKEKGCALIHFVALDALRTFEHPVYSEPMNRMDERTSAGPAASGIS